MKLCSKCKRCKSSNSFYGATHAWCKECDKEYSRNYRNKHRKESILKSREYKKNNKEKVSRYSTLYREKNKDKVSKLNKKFRRIPNAHNAQEKTRRAVRSGKIIKPDACKDCGNHTNLHAHHHKGYLPPYETDVIFVCQSCHQLRHRGVKI